MSTVAAVDARPDADGPVAPAVRYHDLAPIDARLVARNVAYLAGVWGTIGAAAVVAAKRPRWWTIGAAAIVISGRQHALLNVEHECIHNMFVGRGKRRNDRVGRWLCAGPSGSTYGAAKQSHLSHHRLLGQPGDPDHELHGGDDKSTRAGLAGHFVRGLLGGYAIRSLRRRGGSDGGEVVEASTADVASVGVAQAALWAVSGPLLGWWVYPVLWAAPLGTLTSCWHLWRSYAEHAVGADELPRHESLLISLDAGPLERFCLSPYNMNLHAEHHLHPFVPAPRLPEVRRRMQSDASAPPVLRRRSYRDAIRANLRTLR